MMVEITAATDSKDRQSMSQQLFLWNKMGEFPTCQADNIVPSHSECLPGQQFHVILNTLTQCDIIRATRSNQSHFSLLQKFWV